MTTRPGSAALSMWSGYRSKRPCNLVQITRRDGFVLRFTDHDRTITYDGYTFAPAQFAGMSAERREGALRTGNQELYGIIDGDSVLVPDLLGSLYRGAEVRHVVTDWSMPWLWVAKHRKWIRNVNWNGSNFVATLEGRSQVLQRPAGGRFGGQWQETCPYTLGSADCGATVSPVLYGAAVDVVTSRMVIEFDSTQWPVGSMEVDGFFAHGEVEWIWAAPVESGTTATATTTTTLTDPSATWTTDEHVGRYVRRLAPGGSDYAFEWAIITSNTGTVLSFAAGQIGVHATSTYDICPASRNAGHISPIVSYSASTRGVTILRPTPFPILVGDSGAVRVGCDGIYQTCVDKFANGVNFGASPLEPTAARIVEPAADQ